MKKRHLPLSLEERKVIQEFCEKFPQDRSLITRILRKLKNRHYNVISREIKINESPYNAEKAQKRTDEERYNQLVNARKKWEENSKKRRESSQLDFLEPETKKTDFNQTLMQSQEQIYFYEEYIKKLETRIQNLEFQIEIILDTLKEIKNDTKDKKLCDV